MAVLWPHKGHKERHDLICVHELATLLLMKTELLKLRVSGPEKEAFQQAADIAGITVSAWARERLRRAAVRDLQDAARPVTFLERGRTQNGR